MKKVLSFVLVLAMILGCTSMAFATYKDQADVTNTEAVAVLSAVGVFAGDQNGNMNPKATLTRAEACAVIARLMLGTKAADKLSATAAPFQDVPADNWAAGYVSYCASKGIVGGIGNNMFNPTGTLKVGEFGKMLLCALGYDATAEGLVGADWATNTDALMLTAGIDVDEANGDDCAREVAAQLALNTLQADCVKYDNSGASISVGGTVIEFGKGSAKKVEVASGAGFDDENDQVQQLAEKLYGTKLTKASGTDEFGCPGTLWTYDGKEVGVFGKAAKFTYTAEVTPTTMEKNLKGYTVKGGRLNVSKSADRFTTSTAVDSVASIAALTGNGKTVKLFANASKQITDVVVIEPQLAKITALTTTKANKSHGEYTTYTADDDGASVTLGKVYSTTVADEDADTLVLNGEFAKGDYVTYYKTSDDMTYVDPVSTLNGVLSAVSSADVYTIDGTKYEVSAVGGYVLASANKKAQDFLVDSFGYVIKSITATAEEKYAYLVDVKSYLVQNADETLSSTTFATLVFADGTVEKVKANEGTQTKENVVAYTINTKGVYELTSAGTRTTKAAVLANDSTSVSGLYTNTKTVYYALDYTYADGKYKFDGTVTEYVGYKNAPVYTVAIVAALDNNAEADGIAEVVFIDTTSSAVATGKYVYAKGTYVHTVDGYVNDVIIAGEDDTITTTTLTGIAANTLYESVAGTWTPATDDAAATSPASIQNKGGFVYINGVNKGWTIADDTPVYLINIYDDSVEVLEGVDLETAIKADPKDKHETRGIYVEKTTAGVVQAVYVLFNSED